MFWRNITQRRCNIEKTDHSAIQCWNFKQYKGARNRAGIGLSYRPARLHSLAEVVPWNRLLGPLAQYRNDRQRPPVWSRFQQDMSSLWLQDTYNLQNSWPILRQCRPITTKLNFGMEQILAGSVTDNSRHADLSPTICQQAGLSAHGHRQTDLSRCESDRLSADTQAASRTHASGVLLTNIKHAATSLTNIRHADNDDACSRHVESDEETYSRHAENDNKRGRHAESEDKRLWHADNYVAGSRHADNSVGDSRQAVRSPTGRWHTEVDPVHRRQADSTAVTKRHAESPAAAPCIRHAESTADDMQHARSNDEGSGHISKRVHTFSNRYFHYP